MKSSNRINSKNIIVAVIGVLFIAIGVSFNAQANLGNDPVGIVYDGFRNLLNLTPTELGRASNIFNIGLLVLLAVIGRRYVNLGTLIYMIPYGLFIKIGTGLFQLIFHDPSFVLRIFAAILGSTSLFFGVGLFITADIGVDGFTGLVLVICDFTKKQYRIVKIIFDICCTAFGFLMGGRLGVITVLTAITAGPVIQFFSDHITKILYPERLR